MSMPSTDQLRTELEAELGAGKRWSYWKPLILAANKERQHLEAELERLTAIEEALNRYATAYWACDGTFIEPEILRERMDAFDALLALCLVEPKTLIKSERNTP